MKIKINLLGLAAVLALVFMCAPPAAAKESCLERRLRRATAGLLYRSETDAYFSVVRKDEKSLRRLRRRQQSPEVAGMPRSLSDLFETQTNMLYGAEVRDAARWRRLARLLRSELRHVRVYWSGREPEYRVYILGRTPRGAILGLSVKVVSG